MTFFFFSHKLLCQFLQTSFCLNQICTAYQDGYGLQVLGFCLKSVICWYYKQTNSFSDIGSHICVIFSTSLKTSTVDEIQQLVHYFMACLTKVSGVLWHSCCMLIRHKSFTSQKFFVWIQPSTLPLNLVISLNEVLRMTKLSIPKLRR
jgi:hypothetical protein